MAGIVSFLALSKDVFPCLTPVKSLEIVVEFWIFVLRVVKLVDIMIVFAEST